MPQKKCRSCQSSIDKNAKVCPFCKSSLGWAGKIQPASLVVGTFLALISLVTIAIESVSKLLEKNEADLVMSVAKFNDDNFNVVISNKGNRSAVVYDLTISYPPVEECKNRISKTTDRVEFESKVVEPGHTYNIEVEIQNLYKAFVGFDPQVLSNEVLMKNLEEYKVCSAHITYLDFDQKHKPKEVYFYCGPQGGC
jgi:hypothetical protein